MPTTTVPLWWCKPLLEKLTDDPLDPDDIIAPSFRHKVLQALAEVVPHSLAVSSKVPLGFVQELPCHVHHVHHVKQRQQQPFGDPPDAGTTVEGTTFARLALCFLHDRLTVEWEKKQGGEPHQLLIRLHLKLKDQMQRDLFVIYGLTKPCEQLTTTHSCDTVLW